MINCIWCGKQARLSGQFCSVACSDAHSAMLAKPFRTFASYLEAAEYSGRDTRTIRNYEGVLFAVDKSLRSRRAKLQSCKICGNQFKSAENRNGYCPLCSQAGKGRQAQAALIKQRYQGTGNPNYVDGSTKQTFRHKRLGKRWTKTVIQQDGRCRSCGIEQQLQPHHVLPVALFPDYAIDLHNGITLCGHHHTELHRLRLDLLLLPTLFASLAGALPLHEVLCCQPEFQALRQLPWQPFQKRELLRVTPKNYRRQILRLHPEFAQQVLGLAG